MDNFEILVVDDDPINLEIIKVHLAKLGYAPKEAQGGSEAIELLNRHRFDVVITDLMMPGIDGMEVLNIVKSRYPQTDVIITTAYATVDNAVLALKQGATDYLQKPINFDELAICLQRVALVKSLSHSTDELQTALDVTEQSAAQTIKRLEDMVIDLQRLCANAVKILLDEHVDIRERIPKAVARLNQARQ